MLTQPHSSSDEGFTLVELAVVLFILGLLVAVGTASFASARRVADDKGTQLDLLTAVKVQTLQFLEEDGFTADQQILFDLEPTLRYSVAGDPPGTIVVKIEDGRASLDVCLFAKTDDGDWFAMYHSASDGDRYARSLPGACTANNVAAWSAESW